jgi:hypothetical protein
MIWLYLAYLASLILSTSQRQNRYLYFSNSNDMIYPVDMTEQFFRNRTYLALINSQSKLAKDDSMLQIMPPISNDSKISHSLMYWPLSEPLVSKETCTLRLGLHAIGSKNMVGYQTSLINSMTTWEVVKVNDAKKNLTTNYFIALHLDKTASGYKISRQVESQYIEDNTSSYRCENFLYGGVNKTYILCWRTLSINHSSGNTIYKLTIKLVLWDPRKGTEYNSSSIYIDLNENQFKDLNNVSNTRLALVAEIVKSMREGVFDIFMYFRTLSSFIVFRVKNDEFFEYRFPLEYKGARTDQQLKNVFVKGKSEPIRIYQADYIDGYKFLLTEYKQNFNDTDDSTYSDTYFIDANLSENPMFVGKGIIVTFKKGMDFLKYPLLKEFLIITNCTKALIQDQPRFLITIQIRQFYIGNFFGDQKFELYIQGSPRYFKGFTSELYLVYFDMAPNQPIDVCLENNNFNSTVYIAQADKPHIYQELIGFQNKFLNPTRILVSRNNNLLYLRYAHKLEIFTLDQLIIDLKGHAQFDNNLNVQNKGELVALPSRPDPSKVLDGDFIAIVGKINITSEKDEFVTLKDRIENRTNLAVELMEVKEFKYKFKYPYLFSAVNIVGNYLSFESSITKAQFASVSSFEKRYMSLNPTEFGESNISTIFGMLHENNKYVLVSFQKDYENAIYKFSYENNRYEKYMRLYDNRIVSSVQEVSNDKYLLHIEGLLYDLTLSQKSINPVFKSNDLCGEKYTSVEHNEFGTLTVCGGLDAINIFASNFQKKDKVDLSSPVTNLRINPGLAQALKTETIKELFSSVDFMNRFGSISNIKTYKSTSLTPANPSQLCSIIVRIFEIASSRQSVDVLPESVTTVTFNKTATHILPYIIYPRLVLFIRFTTTIIVNEVPAEVVDNSIHIYRINSNSNLTLEKIVELPKEFLIDLEVVKPLKTYLPMNKTLQTKTYGQKILVMLSLKRENLDISRNLDFFDYTTYLDNHPAVVKYRKMIGVLDVHSTSLDCFKLLDLPDGFETISFGPYFLDEKDSIFGQGAVVAGQLNGVLRIYFMNDHSLIIDFNLINSFQDYFDMPEVLRLNYTFFIKNHLNNEKKQVMYELEISPVLNATYDIEFDKDSKFSVDLSKPNEMPKLFSFLIPVSENNNTHKKDVLYGMPHEFEFIYDSKIEQISKQLEASFKLIVRECNMTKRKEFTNMIFNDDRKYSVSPFLESSINSNWKTAFTYDFVDLLYMSSFIGLPRVELTKKNTDVRPNPNFARKRRCTKFFYSKHINHKYQEELYACLELTTNANELLLFVFDERDNDNYLYTAGTLEEPVARIAIDLEKTPIDNVFLSSTMNFVILEYANQLSMITYKYVVYRIKINDSGPRKQINASEYYTRDIWNSQVTFSNTYFRETDHPEIVVQRFCFVSVVKVHIPMLSYYCQILEDDGVFVPVPIQKDVFSAFRVEDMDKISPLINIYSQSLNPIADNTEAEAGDSLYVLITFQTSFTVFMRLDTINANATFSFKFFCNPFEGYKFLSEKLVVSGKIMAKVGIRAREAYIVYYSLPAAYSPLSDLKSHKYFTVEDLDQAFIRNTSLECVEPSFIKRLDIRVEDVFPLRFFKTEFSQKKADNDSSVKFLTIGDNKNFTITKDALQFLVVTEKGTMFYRIEYLPAFELRAASQLVFSDNIEIKVKGMRNRTGRGMILIRSGNFLNIWFLFKYLIPLIVLIVGLIVMNWLIRSIFYGQDPDDYNDTVLPSMFRPKDFANKISSIKERASLQSNDKISMDASVINNMKKKADKERTRKEMIFKASHRKEVLGETSALLENDLTHEIAELTKFRKLRDEGRLYVELQNIQDDEPMTLIEVSNLAAARYADFKDFMDKEEEEQKKLEKMNKKNKRITMRNLSNLIVPESSESSSPITSVTPNSEEKEESDEDVTKRPLQMRLPGNVVKREISDDEDDSIDDGVTRRRLKTDIMKSFEGITLSQLVFKEDNGKLKDS